MFRLLLTYQPPLNTKEGLWASAAYSRRTRHTHLAITSGNVGIGTTSPTTGKLVVSGGNIDVSGNKVVNLAAPTASSDAATKGFVEAAGGGGVCYTNYGQNSCAAGFTAVLIGYTTMYSAAIFYNIAPGDRPLAAAGGLQCSSITHDTAYDGGMLVYGSSRFQQSTPLNNELCAICCK